MNLPSVKEMYRALVDRDTSYDGVFVIAVRTTGIFCRPSCPARKPREENVEFFPSVGDALATGYRPCKRCRPLEPRGQIPSWLADFMGQREMDPSRRWTDADLRGMSLEPRRVRRWFQSEYGMTFHAYQRAQRLGLAFGDIRNGGDLTGTAFDHGFESLSGFRDAFGKMFGDTPARSRGSEHVVVSRVLTPLGTMVAGATDSGVCLLEFADRRRLEAQITSLRRTLDCAITPGNNAHLTELDEQLKGYFAGTVKEFTLPLVTPGSEFQRNVWSALSRIPYGQTRSYSDVAAEVGRPNAVRAVGRANGDNRIAIVIPCHRVIRSDHTLGGYGGGLRRKQFLLNLEQEPRRLPLS